MAERNETDAAELPPGARFVDAFVIDINGIPRGKRLPAADWREAGGRVAFSAGALVLDARGMMQGPLGIGTLDGDPDGVATPVPGMMHPVPWTAPAGSLAQCLLGMRAGGAPLWYDSREVLARIVDRCRSDGLNPVVACELEFYLVELDDNGRPRPPQAGRRGESGHLCLHHLQANAGFLHSLHDGLAAQGIAAGTLVSEYGPGQFEVNLKHGPDPLLAADQAALLRRAAQGVAASQGLRATFMAKPYPHQAGNGLHVHVSLVDEAGRNRFGLDGGGELMQYAIGGMQALLPASMAMLAPNFSAYRRFKPGAFVAAGAGWGENTRAAAFRIPPGAKAARRIEHRVGGADASPHLAMACILAGLHYGITHRLTPRDTAKLPRNFYAALQALEDCHELADYFPENFVKLFIELKQAETADLLEAVSTQEFAWYL
jgi:glutamine synthetase